MCMNNNKAGSVILLCNIWQKKKEQLIFASHIRWVISVFLKKKQQLKNAKKKKKERREKCHYILVFVGEDNNISDSGVEVEINMSLCFPCIFVKLFGWGWTAAESEGRQIWNIVPPWVVRPGSYSTCRKLFLFTESWLEYQDILHK